MNKHKWYNEIVAWAEGKTIQFRYKTITNFTEWKDFNDEYTVMDFDDVDLEFRVKPNTVKYRLYQYNIDRIYVGFTYAHNDKEIDDQTITYKNNSSFVRWLTDWIELEIGDTE